MIKAVILAGGNGVRMNPLTLTRPKPLMPVVNKTIIEHNLDQLEGLVKEVIIVIGYKGDMIKSLIGDNYGKIKVSYVVQEHQLGTADAAKQAVYFLEDKFILMNGDDLYFREDIKKCLKKYPSILVGRVSTPSFFGVVDCYNDFVRGLIEKPETSDPNALVNTGFYFLDKSIFDFNIEKSLRGEYEFTDYIKAFILNHRLYFRETDKWIPVSYPWNLLGANEFILSSLRRDIRGKVEKGCTINGSVVIEKGAYIKSGTYIEGPAFIRSGAIIGPNAYIRGKTVVGENTRIGANVEIKNSMIGNNTFIPHLSYVGDSIIGDNCNIGAGSIMANFRFDQSSIKVMIKDEMVDSGREKLGVVIGDNSSIGVNSSLMPGVLIGSDSIVGPHSLVKKNVVQGSKYFSEFGESIK